MLVELSVSAEQKLAGNEKLHNILQKDLMITNRTIATSTPSIASSRSQDL